MPTAAIRFGSELMRWYFPKRFGPLKEGKTR